VHGARRAVAVSRTLARQVAVQVEEDSALVFIGSIQSNAPDLRLRRNFSGNEAL